MNRQEYLGSLEKALIAAHVPDSKEIISEYAEHFDRKLQDGYSEEEIAAKLISPKETAGQFGELRHENIKAGSRLLSAGGLFFTDIFMGSFFILLYAWVIALGAFAVASAVSGFIALIGISVWNTIHIIPEMPYICSLLLGITLLALAVLSAIGTEYCRLYVTQILKGYARWHQRIWGKVGISLPLPLHPVINPKKRRIMRTITLIALVVFIVAFITALGSMMLSTGSLEPWHVWHWFE